MRNTSSARTLGAVALLATLAACDLEGPNQDVIQQPGDPQECTETPEEPELLFEEVWSILNATYPYFDYKEIDWQALHDECRELVCEERHAYKDFIGPAATCLLAPLADIHVGITDVDDEFQSYGVTGYTPNSVAAMADARLDDGSLLSGPTSVTGTLNEGRFGYLRVSSFSLGLEDFAQRVADVGVVEGWVIDVRVNGGGNEIAALELAGQYVDDASTPYSFVQYREETDGDPATHELGPQTARTLDADLIAEDVFVGNVALLLGHGCVSSCESFVAMMTLAPNVRTFGATTRGASGNPDDVTLEADGVTRLLSSQWFNTLGDGVTVIEWNGIPPLEPVEFEGGVEDQVLEAAILWVAGG